MKEPPEDSRWFTETLAQARSEDLSDVQALELIELAGLDAEDRPVLVIYGARIRPSEMDMDRVLRYLLLLLEELSHDEYTVIYFNSKVGYRNLPPLLWLQRTYRELPYRFRKNLARVSIVHPSLVFRALFYSLYPLLSEKAWRKVHFADHTDELTLDGVLADSTQLAIPAEADEQQQETQAYVEQTASAFRQGFIR